MKYHGNSSPTWISMDFTDAFFGRVGLSSRPNFLETKSRLLGAVFVSKSTGCFTMKQVTYPEELWLGSVQFKHFLCKKESQLLTKKHMDNREEILVRKINPTYNDRIIYHALGSCMVYLLLFYILLQKNLKLFFLQLHPPLTTRSRILTVLYEENILLQKNKSISQWYAQGASPSGRCRAITRPATAAALNRGDVLGRLRPRGVSWRLERFNWANLVGGWTNPSETY